MDIEQRLRQAIQAGEMLTIIYNGGSNPGTSRKIAPISLTGSKLSAHCYASNAVKTFAIDRIVLPEEEVAASAPTWTPKPARPVEYSTLAELSEQNRETWQTLGWHVELAETMLSLHRYSKRGSGSLKYPDVTLTYEPFAESAEPERMEIRIVISPEHQEASTVLERQPEQAPRQRERPWVVRAPNYGVAFSALDKAAEKFKEYAVTLSPAESKSGA